ncbi:histidine kinase [Actinomadura roseirufa]|uniref:histidine kinase n=1 Tax=Actinomadura roseirufa TaxID=2094049 RepID=UPI001A955DF9|nr:histidine kinase [Actinomadura roseirufa]
MPQHPPLAVPARAFRTGRARIPRGGRARDLAADVAVAGAGLALSVRTAADPATLLRPHGGATAVVLVVPALALALRRRVPMTVAWLTAALPALLWLVESAAPGTLVRTGAPGGLTPFVWWPPTLPFAAYAVMAFPAGAARPVWVRGLPVAAFAALVGFSGEVIPADALRRISTGETDAVNAMMFRSMVVLAVAALLGMYVAARRRVLQGLTDRAERAERERHLLAERARAQERARLAAEMHDVVAHRVTLMVLRGRAPRPRAGRGDARRRRRAAPGRLPGP